VPKYGTGDDSLLLVARAFVVPMCAIACVVAAFSYNPGEHDHAASTL
jgi:hypothetical protein